MQICILFCHITFNLITVSSIIFAENVMNIEVRMINMHWLKFYEGGFLPGCSSRDHLVESIGTNIYTVLPHSIQL
jgi:hypothetical protein